MANLRGRLRELFFRSLDAPIVRPSSSPVYASQYPRTGGTSAGLGEYEPINGVISFYEWSNVDNCARIFYTLKVFLAFLKRSNISIEPYQVDLVKSVRNPHVACLRSGKGLVIASTKEAVRMRLDNEGKNSTGGDANAERKVPGIPTNDGKVAGGMGHSVTEPYLPGVPMLPMVQNSEAAIGEFWGCW